MARNNYDGIDAFTADYYAQYENIISNGEARIPICFCIDTSSSMNFITNRPEEYTIVENSSHTVDGVRNVKGAVAKRGYTLHTRIEKVRGVLTDMLQRMKYDRRISNAAAISIVNFDVFADCIAEFSEIDKLIKGDLISSIDTDERRDKTNASKGIYMALERLDQFSRVNKMAGNESYKPVLIFMSDGDVNEDLGAGAASYEVRERSNAGKLNVIPIAIGRDANESWMRGLTKDGHVYRMEYEDEFDEVFNIIAKRIAKTAMVISVDEEISEKIEDENSVSVNEETSSQYGGRMSADDIMDFLELMNSDDVD